MYKIVYFILNWCFYGPTFPFFSAWYKKNDDKPLPDNNPFPDFSLKENGGKKSLMSRSKQSLARAIRHQHRRDCIETKIDDVDGSKFSDV
ncbi:hypothetical protein RJT34_09072 [Clitoria ternatea]|uniref:Uncharacterized protein n=1 Tax=Clitoria ternatea TaxID=43366 RepID=A0AAN9K5E1_CLITE